MNTTLKIIHNRKSLRAYTTAPITDIHKENIIDSAIRAPTAGNMMLYSILEIETQEIKNKLSILCDNQPFIARAPFVLLFCADLQRWYDYYTLCEVPRFCKENNKNFELPQESELFLCCCDALIAAQNSVIAAESIGIGSCYIGDIMENYEVIKELFQLPSFVFPITLLCFGHYTENYAKRTPTDRFDKKFICFKNTYKRLSDREFHEMFKKYETNPNVSFLENSNNYGQHTYLRKTGSSFQNEMRRSVKVALKNWLEHLS